VKGDAQRFGAWRSGGILALPLIRSREFKFSKNVDTKNETRHYAKPLLSAALLSVVVWSVGVLWCGCLVALLHFLFGIVRLEK